MYSLLFVCTGNICRSPTADGVFRHLVQQEGIEGKFNIDSAGTQGYHQGNPPDHRAIKVAAQNGVDMNFLRARRVRENDFDDFDLILAMDQGHYDELIYLSPSHAKGKIKMFLDFAPHRDENEVPDPWYGTLQDFEYAYELVQDGSTSLLEQLKQDIL